MLRALTSAVYVIAGGEAIDLRLSDIIEGKKEEKPVDGDKIAEGVLSGLLNLYSEGNE